MNTLPAITIADPPNTTGTERGGTYEAQATAGNVTWLVQQAIAERTKTNEIVAKVNELESRIEALETEE